jgi:hypothetical protein
MRHIISLSTIPPRFGAIGPCLQGLLQQRARAEAIELYIPHSYRRFPAWGGGLPEVPEGVTIVRVDEDLGPATKILPAARAYRGQTVELFFGDDDRVYAPDWTQSGLNLRRTHRNAALCGSGFSIRQRYGYDAPDEPRPRMLRPKEHFLTLGYQLTLLYRIMRRSIGMPLPKPPPAFAARSGYTDVLQGYGGVMVRPEFFDDAAWVIPPALWAVDDVWLSGMLALKGVPIWVDRGLHHVSNETEAGEADPLYRAVIDGFGREDANCACIDYMRSTYGVWGGVTAAKG